MRAISKRVDALEASNGGNGPLRWVEIIVPKHLAKEQAKAEYEAEHGPLGDDVGIIYRVIVSPGSDQSV